MLLRFLKQNYLLIFLMLLALFVRLYHLSSFTVFLADQGSAGVLIYDAWEEKRLPLVGQAFSTGLYPGPAYLYLIALPLIVSGFNPLVPVVWFVTLGVASVCIIYLFGSSLYSRKVGLILGGIYAFSPRIVAQNRDMWNPTLIPFFVLLVLEAMYQIKEKKNFGYLVLLGFSNSILIQLHYTNFIVLLISILFWISIAGWELKKEKIPNIVKWSIVGAIAFILPLIPYFIYEYQNNFINTRGLLLSIFFQDETIRNISVFEMFRWLYLDIYRYIFKSANQLLLYLLIFVSLVSIKFRKNIFWNRLFIFWLIIGLLSIALYKGPIHEHYYFFLLPIPLFLLGAIIHPIIGNNKYRVLLTVIILLYLAFLIVNVDSFNKEGRNDLSSTKALTQNMIKIAQDKPFSFTIIESPSFSDYHFRFFFRKNNSNPWPVMDKSYDKLFIICEKTNCPSDNEISKRSLVQVMCYDHHCQGEYPTLDLRDFRFLYALRENNSTLYIFERAKIF